MTWQYLQCRRDMSSVNTEGCGQREHQRRSPRTGRRLMTRPRHHVSEAALTWAHLALAIGPHPPARPELHALGASQIRRQMWSSLIVIAGGYPANPLRMHLNHDARGIESRLDRSDRLRCH
jgi:hypothetical protein